MFFKSSSTPHGTVYMRQLKPVAHTLRLAALVLIALALHVSGIAHAQDTTPEEIADDLAKIRELRQTEGSEPDEIMLLHQIEEKILETPSLRQEPQFLKVACDVKMRLTALTLSRGGRLSDFDKIMILAWSKQCVEYAREAGSHVAPWMSVLEAHHMAAGVYEGDGNIDKWIEADNNALLTMYPILARVETLPQAMQITRTFLTPIVSRISMSRHEKYGSTRASRDTNIEKSLGVLSQLQNLKSAASSEADMPDHAKQAIFLTLFDTLGKVRPGDTATASEREKEMVLFARGLAFASVISSTETPGAPDWASQKTQLGDAIIESIVFARELGQDENAKVLERIMQKVQEL